MNDPFDLPPDVLARIPLFAELSRVLSWSGGPVNWDLAKQVAVSLAAGERPPRQPDGSDHERAAEHIRIAELWLAETTGLPEPAHMVRVRAASPVDWATEAVTTYPELIDPIAGKVSKLMGDHAGSLGAEAQGNVVIQALSQFAPMLMGIQIGVTLGRMAGEVLSSHDLPLPAGDGDLLLVLPTIDAAAREFSTDPAATVQIVALRAAARRMQFDGFEWVRAHFFSLYHNYVASLDVDMEAGMERLRQLDLSNPERLQEILSDEGVFMPQPSPQTEEAARRVGVFLAVAEAHTTLAVETAGVRAGDVGKIVEALARRAAEAGEGTRALEAFIGLEASTERRIALRFARAVLDAAGWPGLNKLWEDHDAFPTEPELADPPAWLARVAP